MCPLSSPISFSFLILDRKKKAKVAKGAIKDEESVKASPSGSGRNSPAIAGTSDERKTAAEKRFQEVQRKRVRLIRPMPVYILYLCVPCSLPIR